MLKKLGPVGVIPPPLELKWMPLSRLSSSMIRSVAAEATQRLIASGSVAFPSIVAFCTVPPAHVASTVVVPAVGELIVTVHCPAPAVAHVGEPTNVAVAPP